MVFLNKNIYNESISTETGSGTFSKVRKILNNKK